MYQRATRNHRVGWFVWWLTSGALVSILPVTLLFCLVLVGVYGGFFLVPCVGGPVYGLLVVLYQEQALAKLSLWRVLWMTWVAAGSGLIAFLLSMSGDRVVGFESMLPPAAAEAVGVWLGPSLINFERRRRLAREAGGPDWKAAGTDSST